MSAGDRVLGAVGCFAFAALFILGRHRLAPLMKGYIDRPDRDPAAVKPFLVALGIAAALGGLWCLFGTAPAG